MHHYKFKLSLFLFSVGYACCLMAQSPEQLVPYRPSTAVVQQLLSQKLPELGGNPSLRSVKQNEANQLRSTRQQIFSNCLQNYLKLPKAIEGEERNIISTRNGGLAAVFISDERSTINFLLSDHSLKVVAAKKFLVPPAIYHHFSLVQTTNGGFLLAGIAEATGPNNRIVFIRLNAEGNMVWSRAYTYEFGNASANNALKPTNVAEIVLGTNNDYYVLVANAKKSILHLNDQGAIINSFLYANSSGAFDYGVGLTRTIDGGLAITGFDNFSGISLIKLDPNLNVSWAKSFNGPGGCEDLGSEIVQLPNGDFILGGWTKSYGNADCGAGHADGFLLKTNSNGILQWSRTYGGVGAMDYMLDLQLKDNSTVYASMFSQSLGNGWSTVIMEIATANGQLNKSVLYDFSSHDRFRVLPWADSLATVGYSEGVNGGLNSLVVLRSDLNFIPNPDLGPLTPKIINTPNSAFVPQFQSDLDQSKFALQTAEVSFVPTVENRLVELVPLCESTCSQQDSLTLVQIYKLFQQRNWPLSWDLNQPMNTWEGVLRNSEGCVIGLNLKLNGLTSELISQVKKLEMLQSLNVKNGKLSFEHMIQLKADLNTIQLVYSPQDSLLSDTLIVKNVGENLQIDLQIDSSIVDNRYRWFKNNLAIDTLIGNNKFNLSTLQLADSGRYRVEVSNPRVPDLTLLSHTITLEVRAVCRDTSIFIDTAICEGDTLKVGTNLYTQAGVYRDTFQTSTGCDSILIHNLSILKAIPVVSIEGDRSACAGSRTQLLAQHTKASFFWSNGDSTALVNLAPGVYFLTTRDSMGCTRVDTVRVAERPAPAAPADETILYCANTPLPELIAHLKSSETAEWFDSPFGGVQLAAGPIFNPKQMGAYFYQILDTISNCRSQQRASISVQENKMPPRFLYCPANITTYLNRDQRDLPVGWVLPIAESECSPSLELFSNYEPGDRFPLGTSRVTYTARDANGIQSTCSFTVQVLPTADLTLYVDTVGARYSEDTLLIPIRVLDFAAVQGVQGSIGLSDSTLARLVGWQSAGVLPGLEVFQPNLDQLTWVWDDETTQGLSLPDSSAIFFLKVLLKDIPSNNCVGVVFKELPTPIWVQQAQQPLIRPTTIDGRVCLPLQFRIAGTIYRENRDRISYVTVNCSDQTPYRSNPTGRYSFNALPRGKEYLLRPVLDTLPVNGVNVGDIVGLNDHLLGLRAITSPYTMLAGDVNNSGSLSLEDIVSIRRLILGQLKAFEKVPSWRFVPAGYRFKDPLNPWGFPEMLLFPHLRKDSLNADFVAVKMGDVNQSAKTTLRAENAILLRAERGTGARTRELILTPEVQDLQGLQFDLTCNQPIANLLQLSANIGNLAFQQISASRIRVLWYRSNAIEKGLVQFQIRAEGNVNISQLSTLSIEQTLAIDADHQEHRLMLDYADQATLEPLHQVIPNPVHDRGVLHFSSAYPAKMQVSILDAVGRIVLTETIHAPVGGYTWAIPVAALQQTGLYFYRIESNGENFTGKFIKAKD